jgi:hypothetical protein
MQNTPGSTTDKRTVVGVFDGDKPHIRILY